MAAGLGGGAKITYSFGRPFATSVSSQAVSRGRVRESPVLVLASRVSMSRSFTSRGFLFFFPSVLVSPVVLL
jgi:hypothetical protein